MLRGLALTLEAKRLVWRAVRELGPGELAVLAYFLREVSVGWDRALEDLEMETGIDRAGILGVIRSLESKGYLEVHTELCINLARWIREALSIEARTNGGDLLGAGGRVSRALRSLLGG